MNESWGLLAFSVLTVVSAALAVSFSDTRKVIIASWVASMSVGAIFLATGAEFLAFIQWITGTLVTISFIVYATLFGEYGRVDARSVREKAFDALPAMLIGTAFFSMISLAMRGFLHQEPASTAVAQANDLVAVGRNLAEKHVVSLELVSFMLLAVLIGAGVISRGEPRTETKERRTI